MRRYLWMAALSAVRFNPAVRALYARVVAKHPHQKAIAIGHAMRKLLHLVFAVWKTKKPFDKTHYPWDTPAPGESPAQPTSVTAPSARKETAGLTLTAEPARKEVTAVSSLDAASLPRRRVEPGSVHRLRARQKATADHARLRAPGHRRALEGTGAAEALCVSDPSRRRTRPHVQRQRE